MSFGKRFSCLKRVLTVLLLAWLVSRSAIAAPAARPKSGAKVDFNRDIRPLFSENCYACHGPDQNKRKAGLRLDQQEGALAELKSGNRAIVPGEISKSAIIAR